MLNPKFSQEGWKAKNKHIDVAQLAQSIRSGDFVALSQGITLIESKLGSDSEKKNELLSTLFPHTGKSYRIGITGVPGVGKSTFIEQFGLTAIEKNHKVAVLSVDPSSAKSGGSILGDKTRMNELSKHPMAYVRPSASGQHLGGVAQRTRESMLLCEAAGFDFVIIETVGVGQSEIEAMQLTDFFLLLMLAGAGDELQGIKRGIMETADAIAITKADGKNVQNAKNAAQEYRRALHLMPPHEGDWIPKVGITSSLENKGMDEVIKWLYLYKDHCQNNGYWTQKRVGQASYWFNKHLQEQLLYKLQHHPELQRQLQNAKDEVTNLNLDPFRAADNLLRALRMDIS